MKFYNTPDDLGAKFWENFYKSLSNSTSLEGSFDKAKEILIQDFSKLATKKTCCCFHSHIEGCVRDPSKKGYELYHSNHLACAIQTFKHDINKCLAFKSNPLSQ